MVLGQDREREGRIRDVIDEKSYTNTQHIALRLVLQTNAPCIQRIQEKGVGVGKGHAQGHKSIHTLIINYICT